MSERTLDQEWVELILEARNKGMTKEDILLFLTSYKEQETIEQTDPDANGVGNERFMLRVFSIK